MERINIILIDYSNNTIEYVEPLGECKGTNVILLFLNKFFGGTMQMIFDNNPITYDEKNND